MSSSSPKFSQWNKSSSPNPTSPMALATTPNNKIHSVDESKVYGIETPLDDALGMSSADLYKDMLETEGLFHTYNTRANYIPYRRYLVDWMSDLGERCKLCPTTVHCSIMYMDKMLSMRDIPRNHWQLLATACVSVASKYEEAEELCPTIPDLLNLTKLKSSGTTSLHFRDRGELEVLRLLGWKLRALPPMHFVGYYLGKGVLFENDRWQNRRLMEKIPRYMKKYAEFFCNLCLQEHSFCQYSRSKLAAAVILASRAALHIEPQWRPELTRLTGYTYEQINPIFEHVWDHYEEQFPGHGSRGPSPQSVTQFDQAT